MGLADVAEVPAAEAPPPRGRVQPSPLPTQGLERKVVWGTCTYISSPASCKREGRT